MALIVLLLPFKFNRLNLLSSKVYKNIEYPATQSKHPNGQGNRWNMDGATFIYIHRLSVRHRLEFVNLVLKPVFVVLSLCVCFLRPALMSLAVRTCGVLLAAVQGLVVWYNVSYL